MINSRIEDLISYFSNGNKSAFAKEIGVTPSVIGNITGERKGNPSFEVIQKIIDAFALINAEWLISGHGEMLKNDNLAIIHNPKVLEAKHNQDVPIYDITAAAGLAAIFAHKSQNILDYIKIPNLPLCDGAIYVRGDSMYPILKSGDIIIFKEVQHFDTILYGEMYLISFAINGDDYLSVKYLNRCEDKEYEYVRLVSHNQHHAPMDIHVSSIQALALIKASVRLNTMK